MIINDMVLGNLVWAELPPRTKTIQDDQINCNTEAHECESERTDIDHDKCDDLYKDELCFESEIQ